MPIAFPNSPTQGQTTVTGGRTWTYNGSGWTTGATGSATVTVSNTLPTTTTVGSLWLNSDTGQMSAYFGGEWADFISGGAGGGGITDLPVTFYYANTAPTSANIGDRWIDSETLVQFTYVNDGTSTQWVETTTRSSTGANRSLSNLTANTAINQHLIPAANVTYDLGTSSLRWRDLYLSGNTIDLGGTAIKTTANGVTFSSAANAAAMMPIMVHSLQLGTGNTAVTLHSAGGQLQTVTSTGTTAPVFDGNTSNILRTTNTTVSTSTVSGALQVAGGAGIAGNVYAGAVYTNSLFYANGSAFVSGVTIGGSSGQIQYNNGGSLAGSANLVWDNANIRLGIGVANPSQRLEIGTSTANSSVLVSSTASTNQEFLTFQDNGLNGHATVLRMVDANGTNAYGGLTMYTYRRSDAASLRIHSYNLIANNAASASTEAILDFWARAYSDNFTTLTTGLHSNLKAFRFVTQSSTELVTILASGNMGIGVASPQHSLHTSGDVGIASRFHFTVANAYGGNYGLLGFNWGGAAGTYKDFTIYDYVNSREMFTVTGSSRNITVFGTGLSNTDFRAPIFYDSDDTSYYVNPAGTSILNNVRANNFHDSTGTYNINLGSPSEGRGLVAGYSGGWYAGIGYNVRHSGSSGVMYAPSADTALYLNFGNTNRFNFWFNNSGAAGRSISWTEPGFLDNSGIMQVTGSHRAPIFYDSNDTAYYINPNSGSNTWGLQTNNGGHGDSRWCQRYTHSSSDGNAQILIWCSEPGITYDCAGIGSNIYTSGQYYGRDNSANPYGVYLRFDINNGYSEFWSTTGTPGTNGGQGSRNWYVDSAGNSVSSGNVTAYSDIRLKTNIQVIRGALEKISKIRGVTYDRTDTQNPLTQVGVIAQEVEKVLPEAVSEDEKGIKTVAYGNMVGLLIEAIKELSAKVDSLERKLQ